MNIHKTLIWLAGKEDDPEIYRIYNIACLIAMLYSLMAGIESALAALSPILIVNNFFYSFILGVSFYLSRFKDKLETSRFLSIFFLLVIYTPILWVFNGGSASGIPYYLILFSSFLTVLTVGRKESRNKPIVSNVVLIAYVVVTTVLLIFEFMRPDLFYKFEDPGTRYFDTIISMIFAMTGNYLILRNFIDQYYKQLEQTKEYSRQLEELVIRDTMTGLYNHTYIITRLYDEIEKVKRYQRPLTVMMIDIDHFKQINDTYGHATGDEALIKIAHTIQTTCRAVDIVGRYGGEEFIVLLPETTAAAAFILATRLSGAIENICFNNGMRITVSGGIAQTQSADSPLTLVGRADASLYEAKNHGRNQVRVAPA